MSNAQQISINTLVRSSKYPITWVVSSVGFKFNSVETLTPHQPLTDADRKVLLLDERGDVEFGALCQSVVGLRLLFAVSEQFRREHGNRRIEEFFSLNQRLGRRSVNDMMEAMSRRSLNPLAGAVRNSAIALKEALATTTRGKNGRYSAENPGLPWYEAYVLMLWRGGEDSFATEPSPERTALLPTFAPLFEEGRFEAWLRRKQRAALLHYASKLKFRRIPFGGAPIIISLADGSVRDFLEIVGEIYESYARRNHLDKSDPASLDRFALSRTPIAWTEQTEGIYKASEQYLNGVSSRAELDPDVVSRLLEGLGNYTSILQSDPDDPTVLGRAERGIFLVRFESSSKAHGTGLTPERIRSVWNVINQLSWLDTFARFPSGFWTGLRPAKQKAKELE